MKSSFEGIGQWAATFACDGNVEEGNVVKISGNGKVAVCQNGDGFCGQAVVVGRDGAACTVALGGMMSASYTGTAPVLGWSALSADGNGGVKADESGHTCLVVDVDTAGMIVTFAL